MARGTAFLRARVGMLGRPTPPGEQARRARMIGNALRELDHFLNILVEAAQIVPVRYRLADRHNTARQWRYLQRSLSLPDPSYPRLRALGRSRACLFHCSGIVRRPDARDGAWMTAGWSSNGGALDRVPLGETLSPTPAHLLDTCRFYEGVADDLLTIATYPLSYKAIDVQKEAMKHVSPRLPFAISSRLGGCEMNRVAGNIDNFGPAVAPAAALA